MQHRPQSIKAANWCAVSIESHQIVIKGGFNRRGEMAEAMQYKCADNVTHTFVALRKEAAWFVKGVGGKAKGDLKAVQVLQMLRHEASKADFVALGAEPCPAVAGSDSQSSSASAADAVEEDPMESLISRESVADSVVELVKHNPKKRKIARADVLTLTVPTSPPCVGAANKGRTNIFVYAPQGKRKNAVLYLRADCISWLLSYAADELGCQGVSRTDGSSETSPQKANCSAVDNIHLEWNFEYKRWDAVMLAGHAKGEVMQFGAGDVTPALFKSLRGLDLATSWYSKTNTSANKLAAKEYIILWCKAMTENTLEEFHTVFRPMLEAKSEGDWHAAVVESEADDAATENADADADADADAAGADSAAGGTSDEEVADEEATELGAEDA